MPAHDPGSQHGVATPRRLPPAANCTVEIQFITLTLDSAGPARYIQRDIYRANRCRMPNLCSVMATSCIGKNGAYADGAA